MKARTTRLIGAVAVVAGVTLVLQPAGADHGTEFSNPTPILMPGPGPGNAPPTPAQPYPSTIVVSGLSGTITDVNLTLNGFDCSDRGNDRAYPEDVDILLVGPTGANLVVLSDVGGNNQELASSTVGQFPALDLTLDDQAAAPVPADTQITAGTYRPTDDDDDPGEWGPIVTGADPFPAPAPAPSVATALSVFNGTDPNGTWSLYIVDDYPGPDNCVIQGGWTLDIVTTGTGPTTTAPTTTVAPTTTTTVGGANLPPVAVNDAYTTPMNTTLTVPAPGVLANDSDPNGDPLTAGMPTNPANGTLNLSTNGGFTYTPNTGFTGVDTFTYMAHDPFGGMTTATVTITVTGGTTTTMAPTTTTMAPTTTTTMAPTTTTTMAPTTTTTTMAPTTTTTVAPTTTTTTVQQTTTTMAPTTTSTVAGNCKPGWGKGDQKHCHSGPPGQLKKDNVANVEDSSSWGGAVLLGIGLVLWLSARPRRRSS